MDIILHLGIRRRLRLGFPKLDKISSSSNEPSFSAAMDFEDSLSDAKASSGDEPSSSSAAMVSSDPSSEENIPYVFVESTLSYFGSGYKDRNVVRQLVKRAEEAGFKLKLLLVL